MELLAAATLTCNPVTRQSYIDFIVKRGFEQTMMLDTFSIYSNSNGETTAVFDDLEGRESIMTAQIHMLISGREDFVAAIIELTGEPPTITWQ